MIANSELWGGLVWLGLGAFIIWTGADVGLGSTREPGSGFALFWLGILMVALSLVVLTDAVRKGGATFAELWAGTRFGRVLLVIALLLAYALAFQPVGFIVSTLALLLVLMWFVDPVEWYLALGVAIVATGGVWWTLTKALKIKLPSGVLEPWLG
jgi:putative tricarboxylic transport membrane protein